MPLVGLGTWKIEKSACADVVYTAIKVGYRLIDCASDYGNEKEVGEGISRALKEGLVKVLSDPDSSNLSRERNYLSLLNCGTRITPRKM